MRISALEEYGLRCALQLARAKLKNELIAASVISEKEGLSVEYVSKIMHLFRKSGLVLSTRGIQGGFALAKDPHEVSVKAVLDIVSESQKSSANVADFCKSHKGLQTEACVHSETCSIRPLWTFVFDVFDRVLVSITLADLLGEAALLTKKIRGASSLELYVPAAAAAAPTPARMLGDLQ